MSIRVDDDLDIDFEEEVNVPEEDVLEKPEASEESEPENDQEEDEEEDRVVTIGDEDPETEEPEESEDKETPGWVKKVRKVNRKQEAEIRQLRKQLEEKKAETVKPVELGPKPTLASCNYDDEKYADAVIAYADKKRKVDEQAKEQARIVEEQNKDWQTRKEKYVNLKQEHSFKDFDEIESLVADTFSVTQQGIIVQGAKDSALLIYALGKHPKELERLSKISNTIDFAFEIARLETKLGVKNRKAPAPEKRVSTSKSGGVTGQSDKVLERLEAEADKTGNRTKVVAYKRKLKAQ